MSSLATYLHVMYFELVLLILHIFDVLTFIISVIGVPGDSNHCIKSYINK